MSPFLFPFCPVPAKLEHRKVLGRTIRKYRERAGLSIEKVAEKADLHHNYVGELERGEKAASIDTLVKIAKGLRIRPAKLLAKL
jgi:transcriptional regulator with XRE-family HTH domain